MLIGYAVQESGHYAAYYRTGDNDRWKVLIRPNEWNDRTIEQIGQALAQLYLTPARRVYG